MDQRLRTRRWNDFRRRADYAPDDVYRHRRLDWEYIPVHPFGDDDPELLARLDLRPEQCIESDVWWGIDGDATLLGCVASVGFGATEYRAKPTTHAERWVYLDVFVDAPYVTREHVEEAMEFFVKAGFPHAPQFALRHGDPPVVFKGSKKRE